MSTKAIIAFIKIRRRVETAQIAVHVDLSVEDVREKLLVLLALGEVSVEVEHEGAGEINFWSIRPPGGSDDPSDATEVEIRDPVHRPKVLSFDAHGWCFDMSLAPRDGTKLDFWYPEIGGYCFRDVFFYTRAQYLRDVVGRKEMDAALIDSWVTQRGRCTEVDLVAAWRLAPGGPTF